MPIPYRSKIKRFVQEIVLRFVYTLDKDFCFDHVFEKYSEDNPNYITLKTRPKTSQNFKRLSNIITPESKKTAIVLQGPVIEKDNFTLESIRIYKKLFPESIIILSTWKECDLAPFVDLCHIIEQDKPKEPGKYNLNLQIKSTLSGIILAKKLGADYTLKVRTDQRLYSKNLIPYLLHILKTNKNKLIIPGFNSFIFRPYSPSDMIMFGPTQELQLYWNIDYSTLSNLDYTKYLSFYKDLSPETKIFIHYLYIKNEDILWTLEDSIVKFKKYFYVLPNEVFDVFWPKYTSKEERWLNYNFTSIHEEWNVINYKITTDYIKNISVSPTDIFTDEVLV